MLDLVGERPFAGRWKAVGLARASRPYSTRYTWLRIGNVRSPAALDPPVHDPLALVRTGPEQLVGRRPVGVLGRGMPLHVPGAEEPLATAVDRAAPVLPGLARGCGAEQRVQLGLADLQTDVYVLEAPPPKKPNRRDASLALNRLSAWSIESCAAPNASPARSTKF
jgi:hypothetical protein